MSVTPEHMTRHEREQAVMRIADRIGASVGSGCNHATLMRVAHERMVAHERERASWIAELTSLREQMADLAILAADDPRKAEGLGGMMTQSGLIERPVGFDRFANILARDHNRKRGITNERKYGE